MSEWLSELDFVELPLKDYLARFDAIQSSSNCSTLKLESAQHFIEPGNESWELFRSGDWDAALSTVADMVQDITQSFDELASRNIATRRLRLTEQPVAPYLQWELHVLNLRARAGEDIRTLLNGHAAMRLGFQPRELVFMGEISMFDIVYSASGRLTGAREYKWGYEIANLKTIVEELFRDATPLATYFDEVISQLPPPNSQ